MYQTFRPRIRLEALFLGPALILATLAPVLHAQNSPAGDEQPAISSKIPLPGPTPGIRPPVARSARLSSGIELWHIEASHILISLTLSLPVGSVDDPSGQAGLAAITAAMLDEGAGSRDALQISDAFDRLGASYSIAADRELSQIHLQVLTRNLEPALDLVSDIARRPRLARSDWARLKQIWINNLEQSNDNPGAVSRNLNYSVVFGEGHPYGHPSSGTVSSIRALELAHAKAFYQEHWNATGAVILSAGAMSLEELLPVLEERFGDWKKGPARKGTPPAYPVDRKPPRVVIHDTPGSSQTVVRISCPGIGRTHEDYEALELVNVIFGGSFTSRLQQNLRVKHGFTYGAGSNFTRLNGPGVFIAAASIRTDATAKSLVEFQREFRRIARAEGGGIQPGEVAKATASLRNNVVESLQSLSGTVDLFADLSGANLPIDHLAKQLASYETLREDSARLDAAAASWLDWERATIILVGDAAVIRKQIAEEQELEISPGAIVEVDVEGRPVEKASTASKEN